MSRTRYLGTAAVVACAASLFLFGLLINQHHFDPVSWSFPGFEADTFDLVRFKHDLERIADGALVLLLLAIVLGFTALFSRRVKLS
jgi:hypothetical protein